MSILQKYKKEIMVSVILAVLYLLTRLYLLTSLPIFTDEAIYIRWAQIGLHDASWRFISLTDGKQPLLIWIMYPFLKLIPDPLLAGRLVSVVCGFFTMIGMWVLSYEIFRNKKVSFIASLLYIFYPLALLHDRLAIYDSMVAMWYVWTLYFSILLIRNITLYRSYNLGLFLGASVLTKSGGFISMALLPFLLFLFDFKQKNKTQQFFKLVGCAIIAVVIGMIMYNLLRLSPLYGTIDAKNAVFLYPLRDWLSHTTAWQYNLFSGNIGTLISWFISYFNVFYLVFLIVGLCLGMFWREKIVLVIYFLLPFIYAAMFGKVLFPRYILFMTDILLIIVAWGIWQTALILFRKRKKLFNPGLVFLSIIAIIPTLYVSIILITNPVQAPIPTSDKFQYIDNWPAGWGVKESIQYLRQQSQSQHIFVGTEGTFGLMPFAFEMYFYNDPNVTTKAYWPIDPTAPADLLAEAKNMPTYVFFYEPCPNCATTGVAPTGWPVTPVLTVEQGYAHATLYKVSAE